ncbi:hypothetical protein L6452_38613 [Arctium lappa]|uniref:Uncharacterized protein n=1 Tax=Arctium lappa TaxID=4217 RepID=A0ACB8XQ92_ARCLA|nr:hypothetical protein L6452_38613 [Arctium lappa]
MPKWQIHSHQSSMVLDDDPPLIFVDSDQYHQQLRHFRCLSSLDSTCDYLNYVVLVVVELMNQVVVGALGRLGFRAMNGVARVLTGVHERCYRLFKHLGGGRTRVLRAF